ncbi:MAG TPA: RNA polymerase sigma factor [Acidobacteriaceae bacterium]|jgi:RNA polymerase sigma-70 factor (ECF subfamily)|nr:RNA polymerase sigma factor [Acidobacteriaceae bacterium]
MAASAQGIEPYTTPAMSCNQPDDILVTEAIGGNSWSFEELVRRYQRRILAVGRRMTGSLADAEDISQQTFLKAFVALPGFQRRCSFATWLTAIAINEARMWNRKRSRLCESAHPGVGGRENAVPPPEIADSRPDPESTYSEKERGIVLFSRVTRLKPSLRRTLEVCDLQEASTTETALLLGITVSAVKSRRSRGRAALRRALEDYRS